MSILLDRQDLFARLIATLTGFFGSATEKPPPSRRLGGDVAEKPHPAHPSSLPLALPPAVLTSHDELADVAYEFERLAGSVDFHGDNAGHSVREKLSDMEHLMFGGYWTPDPADPDNPHFHVTRPVVLICGKLYVYGYDEGYVKGSNEVRKIDLAKLG